jgi:clusterin-associated protein 1
MENFREPNFALVAEVLKWLVNRYDPHAEIPSDTDTPEDRVIFIKAVAQFMASKAHIKLNPKKLYTADGYAVKELLKVASLLYAAMKASDHTQEESSTVVEAGLTPMEINAKVTELKKCRQLASEITSKGAKLYDLLSREVDLKTKREEALSKAIDIDEIDQGLKRSVEAVNDEIQRMKRRLENSASDEANLEAKIEKKKQELERNKKRLKSLQTVKYVHTYAHV